MKWSLPHRDPWPCWLHYEVPAILQVISSVTKKSISAVKFKSIPPDISISLLVRKDADGHTTDTWDSHRTPFWFH